jgi:hypothetical protein
MLPDTDLPSFLQLLWNSRIFVCFHASCMKWLSSRIFKLNLSRFLPVGQLLPFLFICTMFCQCQLSQLHIKKRQKAGRLLSLRNAIFCCLGRRSDANISYFYCMNTQGLCFEKGGKRPRKCNFLAIWGTQISKFPPGRANYGGASSTLTQGNYLPA